SPRRPCPHPPGDPPARLRRSRSRTPHRPAAARAKAVSIRVRRSWATSLPPARTGTLPARRGPVNPSTVRPQGSLYGCPRVAVASPPRAVVSNFERDATASDVARENRPRDESRESGREEITGCAGGRVASGTLRSPARRGPLSSGTTEDDPQRLQSRGQGAGPQAEQRRRPALPGELSPRGPQGPLEVGLLQLANLGIGQDPFGVRL